MSFRSAFSRFLKSVALAFCGMIFWSTSTLAAAPSVVTVVVPTTSTEQVVLTWTNPAEVDFTGTMVRYSTSTFPSSTSDGTLASDVAGAPSGTSTVTVSGLTNGTTYYFSLFSHNAVPEYSAAVNAQQIVMPTAFSEDFQSRSIADINGQNGWTVLGGVWSVVNTSGEYTLKSTSSSTAFQTNRVTNGGSVSTYSNQMLRADWKGSTTTLPGIVFLRAQSASADAGGYYLWQNTGSLRVAYKTTSGSTSTEMGTAAFTPSAGVWYTYEFSVMNNSSGLPVISAYVWQRGTAKPSTPTIQVTDTIPRFSQGLFSVGKSNTTLAEYDNITFSAMPSDSSVLALPTNEGIALSWTNPTLAGYSGTMVRFDTGSYPSSPVAGTLVSNVAGVSAGSSSVTHSGRTNGTRYYYTLFPYDSVGTYGAPSYISQVAFPELFNDDFSTETVGSISGQNNWTLTGGTWDVTDIAGNHALIGSNTGTTYPTNKVGNGNSLASDQVLITQFQADSAANSAGFVWLREQLSGGYGYLIWHSGNTWTISYRDAVGLTQIAAAATSAAPPQEANVWFNLEVDMVNSGGVPVISVYVWKRGSEKPTTPTVSGSDSTNRWSAGRIALGKTTTATATYDYVMQYGSAPLLTITSPAADVVAAPNVATRAITDEGGTFYIPYIQTSTTLAVTASVGTTVGGVEFVLNEGLAGETTIIDTTSPYTASFTGLAKDEYTLDAYLLQGDGVTRYSDPASHAERTNIAIGDIINVIGDSIVEGNGGTVDGGVVASWLDADVGTVSADNRNFPQYGIGTTTYNESFLSDLNDRLSAYYGYPVFLMNEGRGGIRASNYESSVMTAGWQTRQSTLGANKWIVMLGVNDNRQGDSPATFETNLTNLLTTFMTTYGATASSMWLSYPMYDFGHGGGGVAYDVGEAAYPAVIDSIRSSMGLQGGADLFNTMENYYATEYNDNVHPNATGYERLARLTAMAMMTPAFSGLSSVNGTQATATWSSLHSYDSSIVGYRVNYGTTSTNLASSAIFGDVTSGVVTGLTPDTTYYFSVQGIDNDAYDLSYSDSSSVLSATTQTVASLASAITGDADVDGHLDRVIVTFSKDLDGSTVAGSDFTVAGYTVASASETSAGVVTVVLTEGASGDTAMTPLVTLVGSVSDTSGNATTSGSATATDAAGPVVISLSPVNGTVSVAVTTPLVLTFSEPINTATLAYTVSPVAIGAAETWSAGNTVVTVSHSAPFMAITLYSWYVTAATDATGIPFAGAVADIGEVTHPATFVTAIRHSSSVTTSPTGGFVLPTITVSTPNGGETFAGGSSTSIRWSSTNDAALPAVILSYSTDGGKTKTTIARDIPNIGTYSWTVPCVSSTTARVFVRGGDLLTYLYQDESDANFTITCSEESSPSTATPTTPPTPSTQVPTGTPVVSGGTGVSPFTGKAENITPVSTGQFIRVDASPTVYFVDADGTRRPFIDAQTFLTYGDFSQVETVSGATLPEIPIGTPMLPKVGTVLVKIQSDSRVYLMESSNGVTTLRWIATESVAETMFGGRWSDYVIDLPPTMMSRFVTGERITTPITVDRSLLKTRDSLLSA